MKYTLNEGYNGDVIATQCGHIFKKEVATEVDENAMSFEVEQNIAQKFVIPWKEEVATIQKEIQEKKKVIAEATKDDAIPIPKGVSTKEKPEESFEEGDNTDIKVGEPAEITHKNKDKESLKD